MSNIGSRLLGFDAYLHECFPNLAATGVQIAKDLRRHAAGLSAPDRPRGIYLLPGVPAHHPLPAILANFLFDEEPIFLDMSCYSQAQSFSLFRGHLVDIASSPLHTVLVFGGIELADTTTLRLLSDLFRDAHLTDQSQQIHDFTGSIFLMTTRVGMPWLSDPASFEYEHVQEALYSCFEHWFIDPIGLILPFFQGGLSHDPSSQQSL